MEQVAALTWQLLVRRKEPVDSFGGLMRYLPDAVDEEQSQG